MTTFHQDFDSINAETLQGLIDSGTVENIQMEYKQEVGNLVSLAEEMCAFANTLGGDLFVGVIEDQGIASSLRGITDPDIDAMMLRYTNAIIGNTDPALTQVRVRPIRLNNGEHVLHFRVNRSFIGPHMITTNNKFPIRVGTQKIAAGVPEIRRLFSGRNDFEQSYERFRARRIEKALRVYGLPEPSLLIHYVPLPAFQVQTEYPVIDMLTRLRIPVLGYTGSNPQINVNGIFNRATNPEAGFTQIFRNGIIELGTARPFMKDAREENPPFEMLLDAFSQELTVNLDMHLANFSALGMRDPFYIIVNMIGVRGVQAARSQNRFNDGAVELDDDFIQLPELWLDPTVGIDSRVDLRPLLRTLWNAFGLNPQ